MYRIATIPGDGIGPEVMEAVVSVLEALAEDSESLDFQILELEAGDRTKARMGVALPAETLKEVERSDACLFVAVGETAKEVILPLRQGLASSRSIENVMPSSSPSMELHQTSPRRE